MLAHALLISAQTSEAQEASHSCVAVKGPEWECDGPTKNVQAQEATHSYIVVEGAVCEGDVARVDVSATTLSKIRWASKVPLYSMPIESGLEMERKAALTS